MRMLVDQENLDSDTDDSEVISTYLCLTVGLTVGRPDFSLQTRNSTAAVSQRRALLIITFLIRGTFISFQLFPPLNQSATVTVPLSPKLSQQEQSVTHGEWKSTYLSTGLKDWVSHCCDHFYHTNNYCTSTSPTTKSTHVSRQPLTLQQTLTTTTPSTSLASKPTAPDGPPFPEPFQQPALPSTATSTITSPAIQSSVCPTTSSPDTIRHVNPPLCTVKPSSSVRTFHPMVYISPSRGSA